MHFWRHKDTRKIYSSNKTIENFKKIFLTSQSAPCNSFVFEASLLWEFGTMMLFQLTLLLCGIFIMIESADFFWFFVVRIKKNLITLYTSNRQCIALMRHMRIMDYWQQNDIAIILNQTQYQSWKPNSSFFALSPLLICAKRYDATTLATQRKDIGFLIPLRWNVFVLRVINQWKLCYG